MLQNIPTHVIAGPLGAGKTSLIRHLLAQRPEGERWAVLINEFGQIGLDAALLATSEDGIALGEVAGGCLCCVNGAPFQIGLGRLLRQARPHRVFIEPSGLGHPAQLLRQLGEAPWQGVLALQPLVMVLDAAALAYGQPLPEAQQEALSTAGLLVMNKSQALPEDKRLWISAQLPDLPLCWTDDGDVAVGRLPSAHTRHAVSDSPASAGLLGGIAPVTRPLAPLSSYPHRAESSYEINPQAGSWSIGWRFDPRLLFAPDQLTAWLEGMDWRRAKLIIHSAMGWQSLNAVDKDIPLWKTSEWRKDSRLELIFTDAQDAEALDTQLRGCVIQAP